jgi:alkaline phosphatase
MNRRNQVLALLLLLAFSGAGVLYFRYWVEQKPFGIVLIIGEGFTAQQLAPARVFGGGAESPLALDAMPHCAVIVNASSDFATPDAAAAATAMATGTLTNNKRVGVSESGQLLTNIIELARQAGRATGLVTDGRLTSPTCAAFYAHLPDAADRSDLARLLAEQKTFDVVLGGGAADFAPGEKGGSRDDDRDLLLELSRTGSDVVRTNADLEAVPSWRRPRVFGVFGDAQLAYADQIELRESQPSLSDLVRRAIELLQYNRSGYLLVVDAALMRKAAEENNGERMLTQASEFDHVISVAQRYAGSRSMIVACGDLGIGGMSLSGHPSTHDHGLGVLGLNSAGEPWITWASGPNGLTKYGAARLSASPTPGLPATLPNEQDADVHAPEEPAAFFAPAALPVVSDTIAFGSGVGAEALHGTLPQTAIFRLLSDNL